MTGSPNRPVLDSTALDRLPTDPGTSGYVEKLREESPRRWRVFFQFSEGGPLSLWLNPAMRSSLRFLIGARWSQNWSTAIVLEERTGEQTALLRYRCAPAEFAGMVVRLGELFNWAFIMPEVNNAEFREGLVGNYPLDRIYSGVLGTGSGLPPAVGFEMMDSTRPRLITALRDAVRDGAIRLRGSLMIEQCRAFVIKPDGTVGGADGSDEDCVWVAALAAFGLEVAPKPEPYVRRLKGAFVDPRASRGKGPGSWR